VSPEYQQAPTVTGSTYAESVAAATQKDWPGYLGAPRLGNAALGRRIWTSFSSTTLKTTLEILNGTDPATYPRYLPIMAKNPPYQKWIAAANDRDRTIGERQQSWNARRQQTVIGDAARQLALLETAWNTAHLANDVTALDRLWADDIVVFVPGMRPMNKGDALAIHRNGGATFSRYETSEVDARITGDLAVVTGRLHRTRNFGGRQGSDNWLFRKVYRRNASGWRVISYHAWVRP